MEQWMMVITNIYGREGSIEELNYLMKFTFSRLHPEVFHRSRKLFWRANFHNPFASKPIKFETLLSMVEEMLEAEQV